ncbi:unnamed protein product [Alopecurus aequalis]
MLVVMAAHPSVVTVAPLRPPPPDDVRKRTSPWRYWILATFNHGHRNQPPSTATHIPPPEINRRRAGMSASPIPSLLAKAQRYMEPNVLEHILDGREKPTNLPLALLKDITAHFSEEREIGHGGFATVYKGVLPNGNVAVKRIRSGHTINEKLFHREVNSLLTINHPNIVRFLGFCASTDQTAIKIEGLKEHIYAEIRERLLCFEYISNGNLQKHITDELRGLDWSTRYQIIKGMCDGLHYLHMEKHIYHMDLKPANILLDNDMVPMITDFGLSRLDEKSQTMSVDRPGTLGYCAPEYIRRGKMSFKSDIYSLGTIITELVTGEKCVPDNNINNISPYLDDDILGVEPLELHFPFGLNTEISCLLQLTNDTDSSIAFEVQKMSPLPYCIEPYKGIIRPHSKRDVNITLQPQDKEPQCANEFIVRSTKVNCDLKTEHMTTSMFSKYMGNVVDEVNLDVVFDPLHTESEACSVKFIARMGWFLVGTQDGLIHVYSYKREIRRIASFKWTDNYFYGKMSLAIHPTQSYVLSGCSTEIKLWDWDYEWDGWKCIQEFKEHTKAINAVMFNPEDYNSFASASGGGTIKVWSINSPKSKYTLSGHSGEVNCLDFFTRDGQQYFISGSDDKTAKIWDMQKTDCVCTLPHRSEVRFVVPHRSLPLLVTGTQGGHVHLWCSTNFRLKQILHIGGLSWFRDDSMVTGLVCLNESGRVVIGHVRRLSVIEISDEEKQGDSSGNNQKSISTTD